MQESSQPGWHLQVKILRFQISIWNCPICLQKLKKADIRVEIDDRNEKIGKKIRIPDDESSYICSLWAKRKWRMEGIRPQAGQGDLGALPVEDFGGKTW